MKDVVERDIPSKPAKCDVWMLAILALAAIYHGIYLGYTPYTERNPDGDTHLQYVKLILDRHSLPDAGMCPMCHHPPLYYLIGAIAVSVTRHFGVVDVPRLLQVLALVFTTGAMCVAALTMQRFVANVTMRRLGLLLVAFWPTTVMASCRLHSDSLVNLLVIAAGYFAMAWYEEGRTRQLLLASLLAGMALLTKASGLSAIGLVALLVAVRITRASFSLKLLRQVAPAIVTLGLFVAFAYLLKGATRDAGACHQIAGRWCQFPDKAMPNGLAAFTHFDFGEFVKNPYLVVGANGPERAIFWNCLLKSSVLGMVQGPPLASAAFVGNPQLARGLNVLLLAILGFIGVSLLRVGSEWYKRYWPMLSAVAIAIGLVLAFRATIPNPYHSDFRHCQPALVWSVVVLVTCIDSWRGKWRAGRYVGLALGTLMLLGSVVYHLPRWG